MKIILLLIASSCALPVFKRLTATELSGAFDKLAKAGAQRAGDYKKFVSKYDKGFNSSTEVESRYKNFVKSLENVDRFNKEANGLAKYEINEFSDWTWDEFKAKRLSKFSGFSSDFKAKNNGTNNKTRFRRASHPDNWDWRQSGIVSPVKDQGSCGSCWAFASIAVLEAMAAKQGKGMNDYAEQQMVDCIDYGCDGGFLDHAFGYLQDHGAPFESDYQYRQARGSCHDATIRMKFAQMVMVDQNEEQMAASMTDGGPFAAGFKVGPSFQYYKSGIITSRDCDSDLQGYHATAYVGYGIENGRSYWIGKNSWGTGWGENGFYRVERNVNWCDIASGPVAGWV